MKKTLNRTEAVKIIRKYVFSLQRAVELYNYLSCYGELKLTKDTIENYFNNY